MHFIDGREIKVLVTDERKYRRKNGQKEARKERRKNEKPKEWKYERKKEGKTETRQDTWISMVSQPELYQWIPVKKQSNVYNRRWEVEMNTSSTSWKA